MRPAKESYFLMLSITDWQHSRPLLITLITQRDETIRGTAFCAVESPIALFAALQVWHLGLLQVAISDELDAAFLDEGFHARVRPGVGYALTICGDIFVTDVADGAELGRVETWMVDEEMR